MNRVRLVLTLSAIAIAAASLLVSHKLVRDLSREERVRMEVWSEAMRSLISADGTTDLSLVLKVIDGNNTIPVVVTDADGDVTAARNVTDTLAVLRTGQAMRIYLDRKDYITVHYSESLMLRRLAAWPYVQLGVVGLFAAVAVFALLSSKRAEQNKVWVGLSRETAHQLGTPISSLMAWQEMLSDAYPDDPLLPDMRKDVQRLQLIAERFSKIGSAPEFREENLYAVVERVVDYLARRTSRRVSFVTELPADGCRARICAPLFEWVIENLCKNAVDAMAGQGEIRITSEKRAGGVTLLVSDTGKGIPKSRWKTVFRPGYTTKKRGWGLGLSLAKRIVEEYHGGRIGVRSSDPVHGTTFYISLRA